MRKSFKLTLSYSFWWLISLRSLRAPMGFSPVELCKKYLSELEYKKAVDASLSAAKRFPNSHKAHGCLGRVYIGLIEPQKALKVLKKSVKLAETKQEQFVSYNLLGTTYILLQDFDYALYNYQMALRIAKDMGDAQGEVESLTGIRTVYTLKGNEEKATEYHNEDLRRTPSEKDKSMILFGIAELHLNRQDYNSAEQYLQKALEVAREDFVA